MQFLLFFISPVLSLPKVLAGIKEGKRSSFFLMALFMGLFAYCTMPDQDLFRHFEHFENYSTCELRDITYLDFSLSGIEVYVFSIMGKLGIHFDYFRLWTLFTGFYLLSDIFYWKTIHNDTPYTTADFFNRYIIFLLFFDLFYTVMGLRYGFAICLYLYGVFMLIERKKMIPAVLFLISAYLFHTSFLFLGGASLGLYYLRINKRNMILLVALAFIAMTWFFTYYSDVIGHRAEWYSSTSKVTMYSNMTTNGLIGFFGPKLCALPFVYIVFFYNIKGSKWGRMAVAWLCLSLICITNAVFFYRIWWVFSAIGIFLVLDLEKLYGCFDEKLIQKLKYAGILFVLFNAIPHRNMFIRSDYYRLLEPVPVILYENYEINEILKKYPTAGDFFI